MDRKIDFNKLPDVSFYTILMAKMEALKANGVDQQTKIKGCIHNDKFLCPGCCEDQALTFRKNRSAKNARCMNGKNGFGCTQKNGKLCPSCCYPVPDY